MNFMASMSAMAPVPTFFRDQTSGCHEQGDGGGEDKDSVHSRLDRLLV